MRKLLLASAAGVALAGSALAATASSAINLNANIPEVCTITTTTPSLSLDSGTISGSFTAYCNSNEQVNVGVVSTNGGLKDGSKPIIPYNVSAPGFPSVSSSVLKPGDNANLDLIPSTVGPIPGTTTVPLTFSIPQALNTILAGNYSDVFTVTITY